MPSQPLKLPWLSRPLVLSMWWRVGLLVLVWRLSLLGVSWWADQAFEYQPSFPYAQELLAQTHLPTWLSKWAGFDGVHYLTIIRQGYVGTGLIQAFFPLFPTLIRHLSATQTETGWVITGLLTNWLLVWIGCWYLWRLLRLDFSSSTAWWGVVSLLGFPASVFLGALYSEALFLALSFSALYYARRHHWWHAALLAGLASATRITGVFLLIAIAYEWAASKQFLAKKLALHWPHLVLYLCLGSSGLLLYMGYLEWQFHDPLFFLHVQQEFGAGRSEQLILYPQVVWRYLKMLWATWPFTYRAYSLVLEFLAGIVPIGLALRYWRHVRPSYFWFGLACFLLPTLTGTFSSQIRYLLPVVPLFVGVAALSQKHKPLTALILIFSALLLIINTALYIQGIWIA